MNVEITKKTLNAPSCHYSLTQTGSRKTFYPKEKKLQLKTWPLIHIHHEVFTNS